MMNLTIEQVEEVLRNYAIEIHGEEHAATLSMDVFLANTITSHRYLRGLNLESREACTEAMQLARDKAYKDAKEFALAHDWFSRKALQGMTMAEVAETLFDGD